MAISSGTLSAIAAVAGVAQSMDTARKAEHNKQDIERANDKAKIDAANNANARIKMQRQAMADNSLFTGGGSNGSSSPTGQRTTLGV